MKFLIAETTCDHAQMIGNKLLEHGHIPILADSIDKVLDVMNTQKPGFIIIDYDLGDHNGIDVIRTIRGKSVLDIATWFPIILTLNQYDESLIIEATEAGVDDVLVKPFSFEILFSKYSRLREFITMRENFLDFGRQLKDINDTLMNSNEKLSVLSLSDELTKLANRRGFDECIKREEKICKRHKRQLSLIMIDIDKFKPFNDTLGHQAGDECLVKVGAAIKGALRRVQDFPARYGGEEFVIVLPDTDLDGANQVADIVRLGIESMGIVSPASKHNGVLTASFGVASIDQDYDFKIEDLISQADKMLYRAKEKGGNYVAVSNELVKSNEICKEDKSA